MIQIERRRGVRDSERELGRRELQAAGRTLVVLLAVARLVLHGIGGVLENTVRRLFSCLVGGSSWNQQRKCDSNPRRSREGEERGRPRTMEGWGGGASVAAVVVGARRRTLEGKWMRMVGGEESEPEFPLFLRVQTEGCIREGGDFPRGTG